MSNPPYINDQTATLDPARVSTRIPDSALITIAGQLREWATTHPTATREMEALAGELEGATRRRPNSTNEWIREWEE